MARNMVLMMDPPPKADSIGGSERVAAPLDFSGFAWYIRDGGVLVHSGS
ncbi:MAG: hypothetical protein ACYTG0_10855 [Planctomycetota bacterium]|jgi:hypothetical protein